MGAGIVVADEALVVVAGAVVVTVAETATVSTVTEGATPAGVDVDVDSMGSVLLSPPGADGAAWVGDSEARPTST